MSKSVDRDAIISSLNDSADRFVALTRLTPELLQRSYAEGKWTAHQLIAHVADVEILYSYRIMTAICEPGKTIFAIDPDAWMKGLRGDERPIDQCVSVIRVVRSFLAHQAATISEEAFSHAAIHDQRGSMSVALMFAGVVKHMSHHAEQIEAIRGGRPWPLMG